MSSTTDLIEVYDLLILVDATYSMSEYLASLQSSLPQIISISELTNCFERIGLLAYRDYCDDRLLEWSGWLSTLSQGEEHNVDLMRMAKNLEPIGGGDGPEATKTGLARAYELMRADATTVVLLYTDAPPHTYANGELGVTHSNYGPELKALEDKSSYGGQGPQFADWVSAAKTLRNGEKKAQVFSILERDMGFISAGYYNYLSTMTGGACIYLRDSKPASISKVTVEILLAWMQVEKPGTESVEFPAYLTRYITIENIKLAKSERDTAAKPFFAISWGSTNSSGPSNITQVRLSSNVLKKYLPKKSTPVQDFGKRYKVDEQYKKIAVDQLRRLINDDVVAISLNPVFGSLWRVVCNDRANEVREELITLFGLKVDCIASAEEKARMKNWLEESYDYTAEVLESIESVPAEQRYPCVFLDPTLVFDRETDNTNEDDKAITSFRRDELLEIGRSCDYKILRRLGRVLTRLTYINSADEMPAHIASTSKTDTPRIPMSLANPENKRQFWRILLHIVVPGTMLSARPAALLAALAIRLGVQPLLEAANQEMLLWRDRWNDIEVPENWNVSCLSLLLDADKAYQGRHDKNTLLKADDRLLFERLASYKMLELNMDTTLTVRIGWTPEKAKNSMGPTVICRSCQYPRSVTIMGAHGKCGHCLWTQYKSSEEREAYITAHATKEDNEKTPQTWVECNVQTCRAQYIVYRVENLNVRPKCHYCRNGQKTPLVECTECLNRVIWPKEYRPKNLDLSEFKCYACVDGRKTIVDVETTANKLSKENTTSWLLRNDDKIKEPFNKRSLFHTISTAGTDNFCDKVELFPYVFPTPTSQYTKYPNPLHDPLIITYPGCVMTLGTSISVTNTDLSRSSRQSLTLHGKLIRNNPISELQSWVSRRRTESGTCSLCFSNKRKSDLLPACGRSGCNQRICIACLNGWYGLNGPGRIINIAALSCAFCRRTPAPQTLSKYGMGIHAVGDLALAVKESGSWISAWCRTCGRAKRFIERVCAAGAPPELSDWSCEVCNEWKNKGLELKVKECPGCKVMTEKAGGCNHITCKCGASWCWFCGGQFGSVEIYGHMQEVHGGWYDGEEEEAMGNYEDDLSDY